MSMWLRADRFKVVGFYPYTSIVQRRICEQSHNCINADHEFLEEFGANIKAKAEKLGARWDNKVVVEIAPDKTNEYYTESNLFVGYKDGVICIGLSVWQPDEYTKKYNQTF